jgi:hypothetical protein
MKVLRLVLLLALLAAMPVGAADQLPGPLLVKAYLHWVYPIRGDQESNTQRVYMRLENPTDQPLELIKLQGTFMTPEGEELFVDKLAPQSLAAKAGADLYFRFANPDIRRDLSCRISLRYLLGGRTFERHLQVSEQSRGFPPGYVPAP